MIISIFLDNKLLASFKSIVSRFILAGFLADNFFLESLYFLKIVFPRKFDSSLRNKINSHFGENVRNIL